MSMEEERQNIGRFDRLREFWEKYRLTGHDILKFKRIRNEIKDGRYRVTFSVDEDPELREYIHKLLYSKDVQKDFALHEIDPEDVVFCITDEVTAIESIAFAYQRVERTEGVIVLESGTPIIAINPDHMSKAQLTLPDMIRIVRHELGHIREFREYDDWTRSFPSRMHKIEVLFEDSYQILLLRLEDVLTDYRLMLHQIQWGQYELVTQEIEAFVRMYEKIMDFDMSFVSSLDPLERAFFVAEVTLYIRIPFSRLPERVRTKFQKHIKFDALVDRFGYEPEEVTEGIETAERLDALFHEDRFTRKPGNPKIDEVALVYFPEELHRIGFKWL